MVAEWAEGVILEGGMNLYYMQIHRIVQVSIYRLLISEMFCFQPLIARLRLIILKFGILKQSHLLEQKIIGE